MSKLVKFASPIGLSRDPHWDLSESSGTIEVMTERICSFPECGRPWLARKLCVAHYNQDRRGEELRPVLVRVPQDPICSLDYCDRETRTDGLCGAHYNQVWRGEELRPIRMKRRGLGNCDGSSAECRSSHGYFDKNGYYILLHQWEHPNARQTQPGVIPEHILVMSDLLDRPLFPGENVHHKNGVRNDNRPDNLELWVSRQPNGQRPEDLLKWAYEIIDRYEGAVA